MSSPRRSASPAANASKKTPPLAPGAQVRVDAARALASVVFDGVSLRAALAHAIERIADPRDRALLAGALFSASRWWLRLDAALDLLIDRPLPLKARETRALLVLALSQIVLLELPPYAVVAASVDAVRALGHGQYAALVNALLRRFLRERNAIEAQLDADPITRHAHPRWLLDAIAHDWPDETSSILDANNAQAPLTLRVNRRRSNRVDLLRRLHEAGISAHAVAELPDSIELMHSANVAELPGYIEGAFSVQDSAAQRVLELLDLSDGLRVLDACAAPGGKAAHMLECADLALTALDSDVARLPRMRENLARLGLAADIVAGDAGAPAQWWDGRSFARILVDAPCSATGIIRRQPDIKLHRRRADIEPLAAAQKHLLHALWPLLESGGRLVYTTCSVLREENEAVIGAFLDSHADAHVVDIPVEFGHEARFGRQNLPGENDADGFYYAALDKGAE